MSMKNTNDTIGNTAKSAARFVHADINRIFGVQ